MLTAAGCQARRQRLWNAVPWEVSWLLVADPRHVQYLSNFRVNPFSFSGGERGLLLLERDNGATLLADNFSLRSSSGEAYVDHKVDQKWYDHKHSVTNRDHTLFAALQTVAGRLKGKPGIVEAEWIPVGAREFLGDVSTAVDLGSCLRELRRRKDEDEIALLRQAMRATEAGQARAKEIIRPGISEWDVYREVQAAALAALGRPGIVYGDFRAVNAAQPKAGGLPTDYKLQNGDMFILDYSVVADGYRSDFTNTLAVGTPTNEQRLLLELCQAGMLAGEATLRAGVAARDVFAAVAGPLREARYDLTHHAGHGIGLAHPEPPILVPESDDVLLAGDVITLEPGLYIPGIGGLRIEHNYLITDTGYERLSNHVIALD